MFLKPWFGLTTLIICQNLIINGGLRLHLTLESLYDKLSPDLVLKALREAMVSCREHWSSGFKDWIISLVRLSINASIGEFQGKFYKQKNGLPTGGSLIVEIANIAVFYVLKHCLYSDKHAMKDIVDIKRYIDDGVGFHTMTKRSFVNWRKMVSKRVMKFGKLKIKDEDWNVPETKTGPVNFLDIKFWLDTDKSLQTDLYRKPTDARQFLHFSSCHPNHTFSGVVYSQGLRLRRIINDDKRLDQQLNDLYLAFRKYKYPVNLLKNIFKKVKEKERVLTKVVKEDVKDDRIMVISTHGRDQKLIKVLKRVESKCDGVKFHYVKKTAPSLRNVLVQSKKASLGNPLGKTKKCGKKNCQTCKLVTRKDHIIGPGGKIIKTANGQCNTRCVIYHCKCSLCDKTYVGKTVTPLNIRINGHRSKYYDCLRYTGDRANLSDDDDHLLGLHLYFEHRLKDCGSFNDTYAFTLLERCNPRNIDLKEHLWIQRLKCIKPYGLNSHDPFGFPIVL